MLITNNQNKSNATMPFERLNTSNFYSWEKHAETYLIQAGYEFHLMFAFFEQFYDSQYYVKTDREKRFIMRKEIILKEKQEYFEKLNRPEIKKEEGVDTKLAKIVEEIENKLENLENQFVDVGTKRAKEENEWMLAESKLKGLLKGLVDEHIWLTAGKKESCYLIWNQLRIEGQTKEAGNFMSLLSQFFAAKQQDGENLVDFAARVQLIAQKLGDLGAEPTWKEIICFRVLSAMKPNEYDNIQSSIFQLPRADITIEKIKSKFAAEDSRRLSNKPKKEERINFIVDRKCKVCDAPMRSGLPKHFTLCLKCARKSREEREEKEEEEKEKKEKSKKKTERSNVVLLL